LVDLNNERAVEQRAKDEYRAMMFRYEQQLEREESLHAARQGNQPVYREHGRHSYFLDQARKALYGSADAETVKRILDYGMQTRVAHERRTGINETDGTGGVAAPPDWIEAA
jgi:FMN phosphatase YigB (HAD superfamily)